MENGELSAITTGGSTKDMLLASKWDLSVSMTVIGHSGVVAPVVSPSG